MTRILIAIILLGWIVFIMWILVEKSFGTHYTTLPCTADSYTDMLSPDINYGTATVLDSEMKYSYIGNTFSDINIRYTFLNFTIPAGLAGKVEIMQAGCWLYFTRIKGNSPLPLTETIYYAGLYPVSGAWIEMGIVWNTQPAITTPAFISYDSQNEIRPHLGWNKVVFTTEGIARLQTAFDIGSFNGIALSVDVSGLDGVPLAQGNYQNLVQVASRESGKGAYLGIGYKVKARVNSRIEVRSLGEVKAVFR